MFKYILHSFFAFILCANCIAQEGLKPLITNINYLYGDLRPAAENNNSNLNNYSEKKLSVAGAPIFVDDFSYAYLQNYPRQSLWNSGPSVYVNTTYAIAPWSVGVATFDGLNKNGYPYNPTLTDLNKSLPADTLTSIPLSLGTYSITDSIALTFYYQARGRGESPELTDSLLLDFFNPLQSSWQTVWYQKGNSSPNINDTMFKRGYVKLDSAYYLQNGFKFRFRNKATTAGNYDHWHLDYVLLDINRGIIKDTSYFDYSFGYIPTPYLKNYAAMPWRQYDTLDMRAKNSVFVRNNGIPNGQVTYINTFYDNSNAVVKNYFSGPQNANDFFKYKGWIKDTVISNPRHQYKFPFLGAPADFKIKHVVYQNTVTASSDFIPANDTVLQHQVFSNFFAFDDGSAEGGYYVNGTGGRMAGKYTLRVSDTLRSVRIYFDQVGAVASNAYKFRIYIWLPGVNGPSNVVLYKDSARTPNYFPNGGINSFSDYILPSPVVLNAGTYYIGIRQEVATGVVVGFDKNIDHSSSLYYDSGNGWTQSSIYGSIMIRPVFGVTMPVGIAETRTEKIDLFSIYPNPASGQVTIRSEQFEKGTYTLINSVGQIINEGKIESSEHSIATENLNNGLYFLILKINNKAVQQNKIIIQH